MSFFRQGDPAPTRILKQCCECHENTDHYHVVPVLTAGSDIGNKVKIYCERCYTICFSEKVNSKIIR